MRPADVQPQFERFEVIGTFNPAAVEFDNGVVLLVRVAERPAKTREGCVALPYWDWRRGGVAIDWRREDEVEPIDPRMVRIKLLPCLHCIFRFNYLLSPGLRETGRACLSQNA